LHSSTHTWPGFFVSSVVGFPMFFMRARHSSIVRGINRRVAVMIFTEILRLCFIDDGAEYYVFVIIYLFIVIDHRIHISHRRSSIVVVVIDRRISRQDEGSNST
jgi:hypothetical protein